MVNMMIKIAWRSLWYRKGAVLMTIVAVGVSVFTLLSAEHLRQTAKQSFSSTVSGVDLIVGPRTSDLNLLLTTVFRIGQPSQNISWQSYQRLAGHKNVAWTIPISLGDSHRGFRVVGTQTQLFTRFQYGQSRHLEFKDGKAFSSLYEVVLGASVASELGYRIGDKLVLSHGLANTSFQSHDAYPFTVSGILDTTGTPVDNALYVSLAGLEAVHGSPPVKSNTSDLAIPPPKSISAMMLGLTTKFVTFKLQREINTSTEEPLTAVLPGVALVQLWQMSRGVESALGLMAQLILIASLLGLGAMMIATLRERSYEFSVLRTLGAGSVTIFILIQAESLLITLLGIALGGVAFLVGIFLANGPVAISYGIDIGISRISAEYWTVIFYVMCGAMVMGTSSALVNVFRQR